MKWEHEENLPTTSKNIVTVLGILSTIMPFQARNYIISYQIYEGPLYLTINEKK